jgi:hypothetical protein
MPAYDFTAMMGNMLGAIVFLIAFAGVLLFIWWRMNLLVSSRMTLPETRLASRRRMGKNKALRIKPEIALDAMTGEQLRQWIERQPTDALAVEIHCERLREGGQWPEYAREMEYLLTLRNKTSVEEQCSRWHELAVLYEQKLGRPAKAEECLMALIATHPRHYQATLARARLAELRERQAR